MKRLLPIALQRSILRTSMSFLLPLVLLNFTGLSAQEKMMTGPEVTASNPMEIMPKGEAPDWAPNIDPQMLAVLEQFKAFEMPKPVEMSAFQLRNAKLPAGAVMALLAKSGMSAKEPKVDISHKILDVGPEEGILVRIYKPVEMNPGEELPVIVYYHGGGWVIADLDTYEPSAKALAAKAGAIVVSVAYRQAPQFTFPTAHDDAFAAYKWVVENTSEIGGDENNIATAGESAGGNLAVAIPIMAKEQNVKLPVHILSVYPIADGDVQSPSYDEYENASPLNRPFMEWFFEKYSPNQESKSDPLISLIDADLEGLPTTTIINAQLDPLEHEGGELAEKMEQAGIDVEREVYQGVTHEFFGMAAVLEQAVEAQKFATDRLKESFGTN
ncbi:alpha/beta hydrolase [Autumnicola edwardsiae]|uniref:Alpha/beta hydrolase n=1 Tax=Autumnicola edwardsiae TaxID=3075594 RepID=A0ABU3CXZ4_9FLAO|nr:alpha/beta hydrolase [Zunongwangia sp. F297]MDT0651131.1 alpha/beta hydrolase [Zunongwangia sp. F297]